MTRVALYTSGFIGGGHLALAEAIARGLARAGTGITLRVFYAELHLALPSGLSCEVTALPTAPEQLRSPASAQASATAQALREFAPDLLLVDLAFAELRYVLPSLECEAWLLLRWIPKRLLGGPFNKTFRPEQYARVIGTEPGLPFEVPFQLEPIVVCNPDECVGPERLRQHLGVVSARPLSLIAHTGKPHEAAGLERLEREAFPQNTVVRLSLYDAHSASGAPALFPLAPWLPGADRIVGGAGYGLYWETHWLGLRGRSELRPFSRGIDDQSPRMRNGEHYVMRRNGADQLAAWVAQG